VLTSKEASRYRVQVLDRALAILDIMAAARQELPLAEIARQVGVHKSTVHRILMSLDQHRMVDQNERTGCYRLGSHLLALSNAALAQFDIRDRAKPYLEKVLYDTEETVHLCVLDQGEVLYLDKVDSSRSIRMTSAVGLRNAAHCTAVGKAMMAWLPEDEVDAIVRQHGLARFTPKTITTPVELKAELKRVRACGYGLDDEEHEEGVRCVAAAVLDHSERPVAAISASAPSFRLPAEKISLMAESVRRAAQELSRELGYVPSRGTAAGNP
jgi:DNA-binding IclR family transcriptional regulator